MSKKPKKKTKWRALRGYETINIGDEFTARDNRSPLQGVTSTGWVPERGVVASAAGKRADYHEGLQWRRKVVAAKKKTPAIRPRIEPSLAKEMRRVRDLFKAHPEKFDGMRPKLSDVGCGCICAHLRLDGETTPQMYARYEAHERALRCIFGDSANKGNDAQWAIRRINRFLRTAK